jgi:Ca2+-binding RTX toxin-like protein
VRPRRRPRRSVPVLALTVVVGLSFLSAIAFTASNVVSASRRTNQTRALDPNELKPADCNGITLTNIVVAGNGTAGADLILGTAAGETIQTGNGNDCALGGGGNDTFIDVGGTDVCIGGPGTDTNGFLGIFLRCDVFIQ